MKILSKKTEMAEAINFGKYPVLTIDLATDCQYFKGELIGVCGCKVKHSPTKYNDNVLYERGELRWWRDSKIFSLSSSSSTISSSFSYYDLMEDIEYANAPIVEETKKEVVIIIHDSKKHKAIFPILVNLSEREQINLIELAMPLFV